jgi:hypothetical protein
VWASLAAGCGESEPVDVNGRYTLNVTNGANACMFDWRAGEAGTVTLVLTQPTENRKTVTGKLEGVAALATLIAWGTETFVGSVDGDEIDMVAQGTRNMVQGACNFSLKVNARATLNGDALVGSVSYSFQTNQVPDCGYRNTCVSVQNMNGVRPPPP